MFARAAVSLVVAVTLFGCASGPARAPTSLSPASPPEWMKAGSGVFRSPYPTIRGVGVASGINSNKLRAATATASARAETAKEVNQLLSALFKRYDMPTEEESQANEELRRKSMEVIAPLIRESQPSATWVARDESTTAALIEVTLEQLQAALQQTFTADEAKRTEISRLLDAHFQELADEQQKLNAKE